MKAVIIGLGQIGMGYDLRLDPQRHVYSHARALRLHPAFHLSGGVDPDAAKRHLFTDTFGAPAYPDVESALAHDTPELVVVGVPTVLHCDIIETVLRHHTPRAILCEKPLAYSLDDARSIVARCTDAGVALFVNYMRRSEPGAVEIARRIAKGELARPIKGICWYSKGFLHNGSHFFNLVEYWLGPMRRFQILDQGRRLNERDREPDVRVDFDQGCVVFLSAWEEAFSHYMVELLSPSGRLRYDRGGELIQWQSAQRDANFDGYTVLALDAQLIPSGMDRYQWYVTDELAKAMAGSPANLCSGTEALRTLEHMTEVLNDQ